MLIILLAYFGGILTILSPCILPVLPFVFARADRSFVRSTLPMLAGMAATFAIVATLAAVGGGWAVRANEVGRWAALLLLALFGIALVFPGISDRLTRPLVALGSRMSEREGQKDSVWSSAVLGVATGLLWAPCAGPILGIIFTAAALNGASFNTTLLLLAYALGAATSLGLALVIGGTVFARMKKSLGASERIRQALGVLVLVGVAAIALGLDTRVLSKLSSAQTASLETGLARKLGASQPMGETSARTNRMGELVLPVEGELPPLTGLGPWFNSAPLTREQLKGKVVVIDFWTYSCINCLRSIPYVKAWDERYRKDGLVVIGVHAPEFAFEREPANVAQAIEESRHPLSGRARQWVCAVARSPEQLLACSLLRRCAGPHPLPPFRRGRLRCLGACDPSVARRGWARTGGAAYGRRCSAIGAEAAADVRRDRIARNLHRLFASRALRFARRADAGQAEDLCGQRRFRSMNGGFTGHGRTAARALARWRLERRSASASTRATFTSCSAPELPSRCGSG